MDGRLTIQPWLPLVMKGELLHDGSSSERLSKGGGLMEWVVERI